VTSLLWITDTLLSEVSREARENPRLRKNRNFHAMSDPVHRLLNAVEPGTYIRPHRHLDAAKAETALVVSGAVGVIVFDDGGALSEKRLLTRGGTDIGVEMPAGVWHTFVALEAGSVFFETKAGPYVPLKPEEMAPWAPAEGTPEAAALEASWREMFSKLSS
jgi:cupin fold WbuC family metalloprotein